MLVPGFLDAPHDSSRCMPSQGFPFFDLSLLFDLLKPYSKSWVWIQDFRNVLGLEQALAANGRHTGGMPVGVPCAVLGSLMGLLGFFWRRALALPKLSLQG